ncbi:multidrug effflux MFS transporter [Corynebacterium breve]|uniref:Multidrug effflux MFS transporter n=1 Tax=Corynebacterium breve TaxID=3049799 RepID=A0ABY8VDN5_9CORY|nr:multidrug effflux MFS transporter [Corynebacterium breve]WIM67056.1 multidrug effflux MFS transporter [Corynebacterium breve]
MRASKPERAIPTPILITLALCSGFAPFAIDTYLAGLPVIAEDLGTSASLTQLTLTAFLLALGLMQLIVGPMSDQMGRKKLMLAGLLGAAAASVVCALAPNIWVLIVGRILQGGFGAAGVVLARASVGDFGRGIGVAKAFALLMSIQSLAPLVAPLIGGVLVPTLGWRSVFWFLAILSAGLFAAALFLVPESLPAEERRPGGIKSSLHDMSALVAHKRYMAPLTVFVATFLVMFAYISGSPFVLQRIGNLGPSAYAITFATNSLMLLVMNLVSAQLVPRLGSVRLVRFGLVLSAVAVVWLTFGVVALSTASWAMILGFFVLVSACGLIMPNASAIALEASGNRRGSGSALMGAAQFLLASGVAPLTGIGNGTTAVPMILVMLAGLAAQLGFFQILKREDTREHYI